MLNCCFLICFKITNAIYNKYIKSILKKLKYDIVIGYLCEFYDVLHTQGEDFSNKEIESFIKKQKTEC